MGPGALLGAAGHHKDHSESTDGVAHTRRPDPILIPSDNEDDLSSEINSPVSEKEVFDDVFEPSLSPSCEITSGQCTACGKTLLRRFSAETDILSMCLCVKDDELAENFHLADLGTSGTFQTDFDQRPTTAILPMAYSCSQLPAHWTPCQACLSPTGDLQHTGQAIFDQSNVPQCHLVTLEENTEVSDITNLPCFPIFDHNNCHNFVL